MTRALTVKSVRNHLSVLKNCIDLKLVVHARQFEISIWKCPKKPLRLDR